MRKYLINVMEFTSDEYTEEKAWQAFIKTEMCAYQMRLNPDVEFAVQRECNWTYIYKIVKAI